MLNSVDVYKTAIFEKITQSNDIEFLTWLYAEILAYKLDQDKNKNIIK